MGFKNTALLQVKCKKSLHSFEASKCVTNRKIVLLLHGDKKKSPA